MSRSPVPVRHWFFVIRPKDTKDRKGQKERYCEVCSSLWSPGNRTRAPLLAMPAALLLAFCLVFEEKAPERTQIPRCNPLPPLW